MPSSPPEANSPPVSSGSIALPELVNQAYALQNDIREKESVIKGLKASLTALENQILSAMLSETNPIHALTTTSAKASLLTQKVPVITDKDAMFAWVVENDAWYLLPSRVNSRPFNELCDSGTTVPGVEQRTLKKLSLRAA